MPKVLIVEDEQYLADMYEMKFKQEGYEVEVAYNGEDGYKKAQAVLPDCILLDIVMPKMDGYEVLRKLKADKKTKRLRVYLLSNLGQADEVNKGLDIGADGYLVKASLTPSQVVQYIEMMGEKSPSKPAAGNNQSNKKAIPAGKPKNGHSVLLIEDEEAIIEMYRLQLEKEGFAVEVARNGAWGLKLAGQNKYDIIVMDMVMPAMTGYEMLSELKAENMNKETPVIVLSNSAQENDIKKTKELGVDSFLLKSKITPIKLAKEINKILK